MQRLGGFVIRTPQHDLVRGINGGVVDLAVAFEKLVDTVCIHVVVVREDRIVDLKLLGGAPRKAECHNRPEHMQAHGVCCLGEIGRAHV